MKQDPRKHIPTLVQSGDHHPHTGFNLWLASKITQYVGTMWAAYAFAVIGVGSIVGILTGNAFLGLVCGALSSYFLQLVLLPVIIVGQNIQASASDARALEDHKTLTAIHEMTKAIDNLQVEQLAILKALDK